MCLDAGGAAVAALFPDESQWEGGHDGAYMPPEGGQIDEGHGLDAQNNDHGHVPTAPMQL